MADFAFADIAHSSENFVLVIATVRKDDKIDVAHIDRRMPPFKHGPERIIADFCHDLCNRNTKAVGAHRHSSAYARENFTRRGIAFLRFDRDRPDIYAHFFALQDAGDVILPNDPELLQQIDAARRLRGGPDDLVSAVAGVVVRARAGMIGTRPMDNAGWRKETPNAA